MVLSAGEPRALCSGTVTHERKPDMTRMTVTPEDMNDFTEFHLEAVDIGPELLAKLAQLRDAGERILKIIEDEVEALAAEVVPALQFPDLMWEAGDFVCETILPRCGWTSVTNVWHSIAGHA